MNKLINQAVFILAISLIFGSFIFQPKETTTDKKLEINNIDIANNNPSETDSNNFNNLLIVKEEYILSYNCSKGIPNWVGWTTNQKNLGDLGRSDDFREDSSLPKKCPKVDENDYRNSGYDQAKPGAARSRTFNAIRRQNQI